MTSILVKSFVDKAVQQALSLQVGRNFEVKELFEKSDWQSIPSRQLKMQIGARFYDKIKSDGILDVDIIELEERPNGATVYKCITKK